MNHVKRHIHLLSLIAASLLLAACNCGHTDDYNVVIALSFIYSAMYIGIMLVVDILYGIIDPRIRVAKDGGNKK